MSLYGSVVIASELCRLQNGKRARGMKRYMGVDLHRTQFVYAQEGDGERERQWRIKELAQFVEQLQDEDEFAVEAMGTTARFYDAVVGGVGRVVVVNPHQFKVISESVKKTDRRDASTGVVSGERTVAGGANEAETAGVDAFAGDARPAGETAVGVEGQDQQPAGHAGDRLEAGGVVEPKALQRVLAVPVWDGEVGVADAGGADRSSECRHPEVEQQSWKKANSCRA